MAITVLCHGQTEAGRKRKGALITSHPWISALSSLTITSNHSCLGSLTSSRCEKHSYVLFVRLSDDLPTGTTRLKLTGPPSS
ncbi:hypothetical protein MPTK1_3g07250 [Marchantia polymorpha subsp. ruderalis]|uniref:Uncharacterized protein n=2 Tax=Marchantia polymorpha TaxID=3197 RepID=A0AAF6AYA6_MARPO|nr:hypothetical protein MARPO_0006s0199 [Marchantia polymorpha]BBN04740.1 hypothetical protein Mp_3g07250 [Marchantia polymorpha subsp. ruderalis]|eukprot:PTQ48185.1 hypothetical protein MARPO_0006s0199 [Marchantia polymorpha]